MLRGREQSQATSVLCLHHNSVHRHVCATQTLPHFVLMVQKRQGYAAGYGQREARCVLFYGLPLRSSIIMHDAGTTLSLLKQ